MSDMFGPTVAPRGAMSARAEASIPKAKNGSINADELNKPRKLTTFGVSKRPRPKPVVAENTCDSPVPERRMKMSLGTSEDTLPLTDEAEQQPLVFIGLDEQEDVSLSAAIEAMVRQVEEKQKQIVRPNNSECPATFSLQEEINMQEAQRMGSYSKEAEDDANDKEVAVESYYAEECFPVRSVMGFVTRNWRVPLKG